MSLAPPRSLTRPLRIPVPPAGGTLMRGTVVGYLSVIVLIPLAAVIWRSTDGGLSGFWRVVGSPDSVAALQLTVLTSAVVVTINAISGTLIAWVLVRDSFRGKWLMDSVIDLPFALPTVVAGLTLLALYGPNSPFHVNAAYTRTGVGIALLFVTLPFVVRSVQPVLLELDRDMEEAAASLGASRITIFRRIIVPSLLPAILSGVGLAFARAMGEFGSVVLISGNIPFQTEVASVRIYANIESNDLPGAAAISIVLLAISFVVLLAISGIQQWSSRHGR